MAKLPQNWAAKDGSSTATPSGNGYIDQESGFKILQENGSGLLQEDIIMTPKELSVWDSL